VEIIMKQLQREGSIIKVFMLFQTKV